MTRSRAAVGLVGVANHGNTILNAILASGTCELAACYDVNRAAAERVGATHGVRVADSYEDLVADPRVEAVALVTPNQLHAGQLRTAVAARKHIFVEKPISNTIADAKEMITLAHEAGLVLMVGHNTRRRLVFRRAKEILDAGALGIIVGIEGNLSRPAGLQPGLPPWKADPHACPLLPMTQLGIHLVDTVEYLVGRVATVSCAAANIAMAGGVYDATAAVLQLESGVPYSLSSYYVSPDAYFLRIYGTHGLLHCYPTSLRLERIQGGEPAGATDEDFSREGAGSYILQMQEFGTCVVTGNAPETGGEEGLRALAVIEAMNESVRRGKAVRVADILQ